MNKIDEDEVARIINISTLSQCLIEDIEQSIYEKEFKHEIVKTGKAFIRALDSKLNRVIGVDNYEAQQQLFEYINIVKSELDEYSQRSKEEIRRRLSS